MSALVIKADTKSSKLLKELAKKLGGKVVPIRDDQFEDLALGNLMNKVKTNENVSRKEIQKKLRK